MRSIRGVHNPLNNKVTVVVPVYADWESLSECIDSLKKYLDKHHKVILINDCGPDADIIEKNIKKAIKYLQNFEYHRNPKNLGFVKTCNRGVLELDKSDNDILLFNSDAILTEGALEEMQSVLYASKKHGTVSPRSNSSSTSSIPLRSQDGEPYSMEHSHKIFEAVKNLLPRYYVAPDSHGFCILIRRSLIDKYGLFDEIYGRGNAEETDFCLRIRRHGYKALIANHAYVYHYHSRSFTAEEKSNLKAKNQKIINERYPELKDMLRDYINNTIDAADWFADVIVSPERPRKIMIDLTHMTKKQNEEAARIVGLIKYLKGRDVKRFEYFVVTNPDVDDFFKFSKYGLRVVRVGERRELFHAGYCPYPISYPNDLLGLNDMCPQFLCRAGEMPPRGGAEYVVARDAKRFADQTVGEISDPDLADLLEKTASTSVDINRLRKRWQHFGNTRPATASRAKRGLKGLLKWSKQT